MGMDMTAENILQNVFLNALRSKHIPVSIFLKNGIQLKGQVRHFDCDVILLAGKEITQMVYRHAISTVLPGEPIDLSDALNAAE